jgi:UDP-N-acetylglucosamine--N-acetylmuramyl-(pentapeptide) pyrophosphoryl-undecaprenol N-acetylglucosamine transferase
VVHLTGDNDPEIGQLQHPQLVERRFSDEIPGLLQHADLTISRAGAGSISELAVCGTPAVLVPFPQAADQHQEANAACAASLGAAVIVHQHEPEQPVLLNTVQRLLGARLGKSGSASDPLTRMSEGMQALAERDAEGQLAGLLQTLVA